MKKNITFLIFVLMISCNPNLKNEFKVNLGDEFEISENTNASARMNCDLVDTNFKKNKILQTWNHNPSDECEGCFSKKSWRFKAIEKGYQRIEVKRYYFSEGYLDIDTVFSYEVFIK